MAWTVKICDEAKKDFRKLDNSIKPQVLAGILKVSQAPLPHPNGYGKPLGNKNGNNLTGFLKFKYKGIGIRVVYTLDKEDSVAEVTGNSFMTDNNVPPHMTITSIEARSGELLV